EHGAELFRRIGVEKIDPREFDAADRVHRQDVDGDDAAVLADALARHLAPAAGRRAKIDNARTAFQHVMLVVDLGELEGRARTEALALGARHVGIVELTLEPELRRHRFALALDPDLELALAAPAAWLFAWLFRFRRHGVAAATSPQ